MVPSSRGSAAVAFLVFASVVFLGGLWLAFGSRDQAVSARLSESRKEVRADPGGSADLVAIDEAGALSKRLNQRTSAPAVPEDLRFRRDAVKVTPPVEPPGVADLDGSLSGFAITLEWRLTGSSETAGFLLERLGDDGSVVFEKRLPPDARNYREGPVALLEENRTFRVTALSRDETVAGAMQKRVRFRVPFEVIYLGPGTEGTSRFGVVAEWEGQRHVEEFMAAPGSTIGGPCLIGEGPAPVDWSTGWRFSRIEGVRRTEEREVSVPVFRPGGGLARDPETGKVLEEFRVVPVVEIIEEALVIPGGTTEMVRLLRKSED
jgi:hypothetical protein